MLKFTSFCKKHSTLIISVFIFCFIMVICTIYYKTQFSDVSERVYSYTLNYGIEDETDRLYNGDVYTYNAAFDENMSNVCLIINTKRATEGSVTVNMLTTEGQLDATSTVSIKDIPKNVFTLFKIDGTVQAGEMYTLEIIPTLENDTYITLATTEDGLISLGAYYQPIGVFFVIFYYTFAFLSAFVCILVFVLMKRNKIKTHTLTFITILLLGIIYNMVLPVYSAPDEMFHINQAFNGSEELLGGQNADNASHNVNYKRPSDNNEIFQINATNVYAYKEIATDFFTLSEYGPRESVLYAQEEVGGYELPYYLSSFLIAVARVLRLGFVPTLYLARLANLVFYAVVICLAVKITPYGKSIISVISLIPVSLHVASSFSRDGFVICVAMLVFAMAMRIVKDADINLKFCIAFLITVTLFVPAKAAYVPLLCLLFILPFDKMKKQNKLTLMVALPVTSIVFYSLTQGSDIIKREVLQLLSHASQPVAQVTKTATTVQAVEAAAFNPYATNYSLAYILDNIPTTFVLLFNTITQRMQFFVYSMFGGSLSYFSIEISWLLVSGFIILLLLAVQNTASDEIVLNAWQKAVVFFSSLLSAALVVAGCILWTPIAYETIYGIQGRYFTPVLPGFAILLKTKFIEIKNDISNIIIFAAVVLNVCVLFSALHIIILR